MLSLIDDSYIFQVMDKVKAYEDLKKDLENGNNCLFRLMLAHSCYWRKLPHNANRIFWAGLNLIIKHPYLIDCTDY